MNKNKSNINQYYKESIHTKLSYIFGVMAVGIQFVIGFRYIDVLFGQLCIVEGIFGLAGLLLLDIFHGKPIYPKKFKKIDPDLLFRVVIIFGIIALIQFIFQIIPLITSTEMALAVVFCAVCEEFFFRGLLMEPTFRIGKKSKKKLRVWNPRNNRNKSSWSKIFTPVDNEISYIEIFGILLQSCFFAAFHVNYYGQPRLIGMVFVGGIWLGLTYWWWRDLTAVILAHFLLNIIFIFQWYQVML
ncbi:hypothetical protein LCGC14_1092610 [marine sediment metagenome]|uniref:CAAX prenyl protease 2/Lysostaphin resistance protein A-like domain-containing protein n=1 Tax=marine sediment metagenome TaxID=412755 RepID=A0A0F9PV30_9ZZZZ